MPERRSDEDDVARSNLRLMRALRREAARFTGGTSGTGSGLPGGTGATGTTTTVVRRVLTTLGDLLYGGEAGAERRLGIGTDGQVLTVVDVAGDLLPRWEAPTGGTGGRYRQPVYTTDGGGSLLWNADGELLFDLQELEA